MRLRPSPALAGHPARLAAPAQPKAIAGRPKPATHGSSRERRRGRGQPAHSAGRQPRFSTRRIQPRRRFPRPARIFGERPIMPADHAALTELPVAEREGRDRPKVIAFVRDQETETALREGLMEAMPLGFDIRRGTVRAAMVALRKCRRRAF